MSNERTNDRERRMIDSRIGLDCVSECYLSSRDADHKLSGGDLGDAITSRLSLVVRVDS